MTKYPLIVVRPISKWRKLWKHYTVLITNTNKTINKWNSKCECMVVWEVDVVNSLVPDGKDGQTHFLGPLHRSIINFPCALSLCRRRTLMHPTCCDSRRPWNRQKTFTYKTITSTEFRKAKKADLQSCGLNLSDLIGSAALYCQ